MTEASHLYAFDLLEWEGNDIRHQAFKDRRQLLQRVLDNFNTLESPI